MVDNGGSPPADPGVFSEAFFANVSQSIQLQISASNATSRTEISNGTPKSPPIHLIEFLEHGFALEVPRHSCARGHNLIIEIQVTAPAEKRMKLSTTTKVEAVSRVSDESERVNVSLIQYEEEAWDRLRRLYSSRQAEIEDFFRAAKGQ